MLWNKTWWIFLARYNASHICKEWILHSYLHGRLVMLYILQKLRWWLWFMIIDIKSMFVWCLPLWYLRNLTKLIEWLHTHQTTCRIQRVIHSHTKFALPIPRDALLARLLASISICLVRKLILISIAHWLIFVDLKALDIWSVFVDCINFFH